MCQRVTGGLFAALVGARTDQFCETLPQKATGEGQTAEGLAFLARLTIRQS